MSKPLFRPLTLLVLVAASACTGAPDATLATRMLCANLGVGCAPRGGPPELPETWSGSCRYVNRFSDGEECRDYLGPWERPRAEADCTTERGTFSDDTPCDVDNAVGWCVLQEESDTPVRVAFVGGSCSENRRGCEVFGGGYFLERGRCGSGEDARDAVLSNPFPEPVESCVDPLPGDPPGAGPGGKVCQQITMQGCTEPGRTWEAYGSCDIPRQQRPYYPVPVAENAEREDPRLQDPAYAAELAWVKEELSACSCFCCHSNKSPQGPANWYLEQPGNFINGMFDTGIAQGAGIIDSTVLGNIPPGRNNGFTRLPSVFPSTDPARMLAFFRAEFQHRGLREEDFTGLQMYGPLTDQWTFEPSECASGEGVSSDGVVTWTGGRARMVLMLEEGSRNPLVPPNLDTPEGTLWRLDAAQPTTTLLASGVAYGDVPDGAVQRFPEQGAPAELTPGTRYYLYVLADYVQPITRCIFTR